jgi:iron complex outermembrane receptor protein
MVPNLKNLTTNKIIQIMKIFFLYLLTAISIVASQSSFANNKFYDPISGIVRNSSGEPVAMASVRVKGSAQGTTTDNEGRFSLNITGNQTLVVSIVGYKETEVLVSGDSKSSLSIILEESARDMEAIILTGSVVSRPPIRSSNPVSAYGSKTIEKMAPASTADLLKHVPGFVAETSGGEVGNNLFARGIPSAGAYEFVQMQEDGLPVFEDGALQFANADNWMRVDETVSRMEALRGGSGSVFATNAPGGIINFISKNGTNKFSGVGKLTGGTSGLFRTDLNFSGAIVPDKLFFNVGGFYRTEDGIRNPGYKANIGGQIKANLKYNLDNGGFIKFYYKKLNDRNLFLLPIPLTDKDNPKGIDGFNPHTGTLASSNYSQLQVPQYGGGYYRRDLENGVHPNVNAVGGEFKIDLGKGFTVNNNVRFTKIGLDYTAIFPGAEPKTAAGFAATYTVNNGTSFPVVGPKYIYANTGMVAHPALVTKVGYWAIDKQMNNLANNLRFDYKQKNMTLSAGYYYSNWTSNQQWNWSNLLIEVSDKPQLLDLVDTSLAPGSANYSRTYHGVSDISFLTREAQTKGDINALFANAEINANEQVTINVGLRYDMDKYQGYKATSKMYSLDSDPNFGTDFSTTTADNSITRVEGPFYYWKYNLNRLSATAALNYKFRSDMAVFLRYSNGFRGPTEEVFYEHASDFSDIKPTVLNQVELGYKYLGKQLSAAANLFYTDISDISFNDYLLNGVAENKFAQARNFGLEAEGEYTAGKFSLSISATVQNPKYRNYAGKDGSGNSFDYNDNRVRRIPNFYGIIRPSYNITKDLSIYAELDHFGKKYADDANLTTLPSFDVLNAGIAYKINRVRFAVDGSNITNTIGLTEGNPRIATPAGSIYFARPILGAAAKATVSIEF